MVRARFRVVAAPFALATLIAGAGCAGPAVAPQALSVAPQSVTGLPQTIQLTPEALARARQNGTIAPPRVTIDRGDAKVGKKTEKVASGGGTLTLPGISGFKGYLTYPSSNAPNGQTITLEDSTSNAFKAPPPPSGTPIWYLQAVLNGNFGFITFNSGNAAAQISAKQLDPSKTYTIYGFAPQYFGNKAIFTIPAGSPNSKHVLAFSSPFNGATIPTGVILDVELCQD